MNGFLCSNGRRVINNDGEIILRGWGLGNWMLPEGYMWLADNIKRFDRPRRIERVIEELVGKEYAEEFWDKFYQKYIKREDILYMSELGYNSVRIPLNWRLFMEEGEGIKWKDRGFILLEKCVQWCEEAGIYAFLDMHGAPGGQTGANIDDSLDDVPRLFIDYDSREKALALWERLAEIYNDREVIGGYDLLNEPIAPGKYDYLIPEVERFYKDVIKVIRNKDEKHLLSIEGVHWATDIEFLSERPDNNMILHFHRYAEMPDIQCLKYFIKKSEELDVPLWLGETGENLNEWYTALYPLAESLGIGYNLWPWKKMECTNSPCSVSAPKDYKLIIQYATGGPHPGYEKARKILDEYLYNIALENCELHPEVTKYVRRRKAFSVLGVDFDELPGKGKSYSGIAEESQTIDYRKGCGMYLIETEKAGKKRFAFDCQWDRLALIMEEGEFACYTINMEGKTRIQIEGEIYDDTELEVSTRKDKEVLQIPVGKKGKVAELELLSGMHDKVKLKILNGKICVKRLHFLKVN